MRSPAHTRGIFHRPWFGLAAAIALLVVLSPLMAAASGQPDPHGSPGAAAQATPAVPAAPGQTEAVSPGHGAASAHGEAGGEPAEHGEPLWKTGARLFNFAILAGTLVYFLRAPTKAYFDGRLASIRGELVGAAEMKRQAGEQIAAVERRLAALPAELKALSEQGASDIAAERERIRRAAEADRQRLVDQARRQMDLRLSVAERDLAAHAADRVIARAAARIRREVDESDQARLVDRFAAQVRASGGPAAGPAQGGRR